MARTVGSAWKAGRGAARSLGRCCHPRGQEQARLCQHDRARNTGPVPLLGALMRNTWQAQFSSKNWNIPGDAMGLGGPRGCPETVMGPSTGRAEHAALRGPEVADSGVPSPWAPHRFRSVVGLQLAAKGRWAVGCAAPERPGVEPKPGAECAAPPPAAGSPESEYFSHFHHLSGPAEPLSCQAAPGEGPSLDHPCRNSPPPRPHSSESACPASSSREHSRCQCSRGLPGSPFLLASAQTALMAPQATAPGTPQST